MNIRIYNDIIRKLRDFFYQLGYIEVPVQHKLSILAACEDVLTISTYNFAGELWPLPQTGQMHLEAYLLENPELQGVFCISTSYRNEPNPIAGRHDLIFPMVEFESKGNMQDLCSLLEQIVSVFGLPHDYKIMYKDACEKFGVNKIEFEQEEALCKNNETCFLMNFPQETHPFWNMKEGENNNYNKIDVLIHGIETIGSAEREVDIFKMRNKFYEISNGEYAGILFKKFGKKRVIKELDKYLSYNMFERFGGGIGITRMIRHFE